MPDLTILYIVIAFVVAGFVAIFQYIGAIKNKEKVSYILAFLRFASILFVGVLLINPKIDKSELETKKPRMAIAIDNSKSIAHFKGESEVLNIVNNLKLNKGLNEKFEIDFYSFGSEVQLLDSLSFSELNTDIAKPFNQFKSIYKDTEGPIVLITDGNQTVGSSFEYLNINKPVFSVVVGDTIKYEDVSISQLNVNKYTYLKNKFPVEVYLNYEGNQDVSKQFSIYNNGRRVYSQSVRFSGDSTSEKVLFFVEANKVGTNYFTAQISALTNEKNSENNKKNFVVEVIDEQSKTLILTSILHPDIGSLKESVEKNRQRKVEVKIVGEKYDLEAYQSVILYQPTQAFKSVFEELQLIQLNYGIVTGSKTDWNFLNSIQPNFNKSVINQTENYRPVFNPAFSSFVIPDVDFESFPPLIDKFGEVSFNSNVDILLWQQIGDYVSQSPLLATFEDEYSRKLLLFGEHSWRWRMASYNQTKSFDNYDNFIGKMMQYLSASGSKNRLTVDAEMLYYLNGQNRISVSYLNKSYEFDKSASIWLSLKNKETNEVSRVPFSLVGNSYAAQLSNVEQGDYSYSIDVENQKESYQGNLKMIDFDIEAQFNNANVDKLVHLSSKSGGEVYFVDNASKLEDDLLNDTRFRPIQRNIVKSKYLIEWQWLLGLIILSLSLEWFIRKYNGLI